MQKTQELNIELASKIGLCEAVLLGYLEEQIEVNPTDQDGRRWTRQTIAEVQEALSLWSKTKVWRALLRLEEQGLVAVQGKYRRMFSVNGDKVREIESGKFVEINH